MKYNQNLLSSWASSKENQLPGLSSLFKHSKIEIMIIGAAVFEFYEIQNWIPPFKRRTGDIDLSVGIIGNDSLYIKGKEILLSLNYTQDTDHRYRFHPNKRLPGGYAYIDLLAHPANQSTSPQVAAKAMGAGPGFSFSGFYFAQKSPYLLEKNISFPNPLGLIALKQEAYLDEPLKRKKDFADIIELISGLVEKGSHFEMDQLWSEISTEPAALKIKEMLLRIMKEDTRWDLDEIRSDLRQRNFDETFINETIPQRIKDFYDALA